MKILTEKIVGKATYFQISESGRNRWYLRRLATTFAELSERLKPWLGIRSLPYRNISIKGKRYHLFRCDDQCITLRSFLINYPDEKDRLDPLEVRRIFSYRTMMQMSNNSEDSILVSRTGYRLYSILEGQRCSELSPGAKRWFDGKYFIGQSLLDYINLDFETDQWLFHVADLINQFFPGQDQGSLILDNINNFLIDVVHQSPERKK